MSYPIGIKYKKTETSNFFEDNKLPYVYLTDIIGLLFTDDYDNGTLKSDHFLLSLLDKTEVWNNYEILDDFLMEFTNFINDSEKFVKTVVINETTNEEIDWFFTDINPILKRKRFFNILKKKTEYRDLRILDDSSFFIHDGKTNLSFNFEALNLDDIYEAIPINGTVDYKKGNKISIIKKILPGISNFESGINELIQLRNFVKSNNLDFSFYDPNE